MPIIASGISVRMVMAASLGLVRDIGHISETPHESAFTYRIAAAIL